MAGGGARPSRRWLWVMRAKFEFTGSRGMTSEVGRYAFSVGILRESGLSSFFGGRRGGECRGGLVNFITLSMMIL